VNEEDANALGGGHGGRSKARGVDPDAARELVDALARI